MYGSVRPRLLDFRVDENTRQKKPPVALKNKGQLENNPTVNQIVQFRGADTVRNDKQLTDDVAAQKTDYQQTQIDPKTRQSRGKNDEVAPITMGRLVPIVPDSKCKKESISNKKCWCNGDVNGGGGVVSGICLNPVSTFLLSQGIPTIRPSFGLNRYAGYK